MIIRKNEHTVLKKKTASENENIIEMGYYFCPIIESPVSIEELPLH